MIGYLSRAFADIVECMRIISLVFICLTEFSNPISATNKKRTFVYQKFSFCLSKPQAWYIIDARSAAYIIKGALRPCISSAPLGLDLPAAL